MNDTGKIWEARLLQRVERTTVRHRHRELVFGLTLPTVVLAVTGLVFELRLGEQLLGDASYAAAIACGILVIALLYSRQLRVTRRPEL